jgi:hypothetical protein
LEALDNKEISSIDGVDSNHSTTVLPLLAPNNTTKYSSNHAAPVKYDNPTFRNESETILDDEDNGLARTNF